MFRVTSGQRGKFTGQNLSRCGQLVADIRQLVLTSMSGSGLTMLAAHNLSKAAIRQVIDKIWMKNNSSCIYETVLLEQFFIDLLSIKLEFFKKKSSPEWEMRFHKFYLIS
jgi:hypothetical protein